MAKSKTKTSGPAASKTKEKEKTKPQPKVKKRNQILKGKHGGQLVVLVEDIPHLGKSGDVVEVKPGYARNFLLPYSKATIPTPHNIKLLERYKVRVQQAREARIADLKALAAQIQTVSVTIEANASEEGHLFGSVGAHEVSKALKGRNLQVEPDMVKMESAIKECGLFAVNLNLGYDIVSEVKVLVVKPTEGGRR